LISKRDRRVLTKMLNDDHYDKNYKNCVATHGRDGHSHASLSKVTLHVMIYFTFDICHIFNVQINKYHLW